MSTTKSLTGDDVTDALVPIAQQLVGAVRNGDTDGVDEALAAAIVVTGGRCDPGVALAVVCAAMVPDEDHPSHLLKWWRFQFEYDRLIAAGISPSVARELTAVGEAEAREAVA